MTVILFKEAKDDLNAIESYVSEQGGPLRAAKVMARLGKAMDNLAFMPGIGRPMPYLARGTLSFPVSSWTIFYTPYEDGITVVRILHSRPDLPAIFSAP